MQHRQGKHWIWVMTGLLSFLALGMPKVVFSLGFGEITLHSYLGEPLNAEIELVGAEEIDTSQLLITLASTEDFKKVQLPRPYFLTRLRFKLVMRDDRSFIHVTTEENVKQPFLEFLVVLSWPDGRLVRGYTVLLDPAPLTGPAGQKKQNIAENNLDDSKALQYFVEKNPRNLNREQSSPIADNVHGNVSMDDDNEIINETAVADLRLKNFRNLENLFESPEDTGTAVFSDEPIIRSKAATVELKRPVNVSALGSAPPIIQAPAVKPLASSVFPTSTSSPLIRMVLNNKPLWASGFALLFVVGLSAWIFRQRRDDWLRRDLKPVEEALSLSRYNKPLSNANANAKVELLDDEMQVKLALAQQYFMINDKESAGEILDDVLSRGNLIDQEMAKELLKKMSTH